MKRLPQRFFRFLTTSSLLIFCNHCVASPVTYRPLFVGTTCFDSAWDAAGCPISGECAPGLADGCTLWRTGVNIFPLSWKGPAAPLPSACSASVSDADGSFDGAVWKPVDQSCSLIAFDRWQARAALAGRRVVLVGDSMLRQLFNHFIATLRGLDVVAQPFLYHNSAKYLANATHDSLCVQPPCAVSPLERPVLSLHFIWSPRALPGEDLVSVEHSDDHENHTAADLAAEIVVAGLLYHLPPSDTLTSHHLALDALASRVQRLFWLTTPGEAFAARNTAMRKWAREEKSGTVRILGLDKMRRDGTYKEQVDGHHFECNVDTKRDAEHQAACRDVHDVPNANLVQMILNSL